MTLFSHLLQCYTVSKWMMRIWILCRVLFKLQNNHFNGNVIELCVIYLACIEIQSSLEPIFRSFVEQKKKKSTPTIILCRASSTLCTLHALQNEAKEEKEGGKKKQCIRNFSHRCSIQTEV